jgi:hypothetical protein
LTGEPPGVEDQSMDRAQARRIVRIVAVVVVIAAIAVQAFVAAQAGVFDPLRFFAYFTIQSNLIGLAAFIWLIARGDRARSRGLEVLRTAAVVYLTVTFFVVILLLSGVDVGLQLGWVDVVLHKIFPIVVVLDWILDPPRTRLVGRDIAAIVVYPSIWTVLTLIRGASDGWYPYPFLNPANGGYGQIGLTVAVVLVAGIVLAAATVWLGNSRRSGPPQPQAA